MDPKVAKFLCYIKGHDWLYVGRRKPFHQCATCGKRVACVWNKCGQYYCDICKQELLKGGYPI